MSFLNGVWIKISAALAFILSVFYVINRRQSKKIKVLKHETATLGKEIEIKKEDSKFKTDIIANEHEEISKGLNDAKNKTNLDRLNNL